MKSLLTSSLSTKLTHNWTCQKLIVPSRWKEEHAESLADTDAEPLKEDAAEDKLHDNVERLRILRDDDPCTVFYVVNVELCFTKVRSRLCSLLKSNSLNLDSDTSLRLSMMLMCALGDKTSFRPTHDHSVTSHKNS